MLLLPAGSISKGKTLSKKLASIYSKLMIMCMDSRSNNLVSNVHFQEEKVSTLSSGPQNQVKANGFRHGNSNTTEIMIGPNRESPFEHIQNEPNRYAIR